MSVHVSEAGVIIRRIIKDTDGNVVDISSATTKQLLLKSPIRTTITKTAVDTTDGTDGSLDYTTTVDDNVLNTEGTWRGQFYIVLPGDITHRTTWFEIEVTALLENVFTGIISRTSIKLYMDITVETDDDLLDEIIKGVSESFHSYIGYDLLKNTVIETIDIEESFIDTVLVSKYPNVSVVAMTNVNVAVDLATISVKANTGRIKKNNGTYFTKGIAGLTIMYTTGYDNYPGDLQLAARESVAFLFNNRDSLGLRSERIGDYSYTMSPSVVEEGLTPFAKGVLDLYKRIT